MNATIISYRRGRNTQNTNQMILEPEVKSRAEASALLGKKCVYSTISGKKLVGKVIALHGTKTAVRARFETPLPPESIGKTIEIMS